MKKLVVLIFLGCSLLALAHGQEVPPKEAVGRILETMGVVMNLGDYEIVTDGPPQTDLDYQLRKKVDSHTEVRMAFYPIGHFKGMDFASISANWSYLLYLEVGGFRLEDQTMTPLATLIDHQTIPSQDVMREFHADSGELILLQGPKSDFARGYQDAAIFVFYKKDKGVVVNYLLHNEGSQVVGRANFASLFYNFQFRE